MASDQDTPTQVTHLLSQPHSTSRAAELLELVYDQLRRMAQAQMNRERDSHTLQATALVHEAYAKLIGSDQLHFEGRAHFFHAAAEAMRRILVDHARSRSRQKRGGDDAGRPARRVSLDAAADLGTDEPEEILSVDAALHRLEEKDADLARLVRLRFYAGLSEQETAAVLGVSDRTVRRDWVLAKAFLHRQLEHEAKG